MNGRFDNKSNDYTFQSTRGHSVVDYICVPHDVYNQCSDFQIISCSDIVENAGLVSMQGENCRIPDHGFLIFDFMIRDFENAHPSENTVTSSTRPIKKYKLRCIPPSFMSSVNVRESLLNMIRIIETCHESQENIDRTYTQLCNIITKEMECSIPKFDWSKRSRKKFRTLKPYWNNELTELWRVMREKEKTFLKHKKGNSVLKQKSFSEYKRAQQELDKRMRFFRRKYNLDLAINLDNFSSNNPKKFWEELRSLGPKRKNKVPTECYTDDNDGSISSDPTYVQNVWKSEFSNLYNPSTDVASNDAFLQRVK